MNTMQFLSRVGTARAGVPITVITAGPIRIVVSDDPTDIVAAQRLRYRVFADEPGFSDTIGDPLTERDADRFDAFCEHLIVHHESDGVIGCARLLPPTSAIAAGGWYGAGEFDLSELAAIASSTVEMGRACVADAHRCGTVTALMWAALLRYMDVGGYQHLIGCVSVPLTGPGEAPVDRGRALRTIHDTLLEKHREVRWRVRPHEAARVDGRLLTDLEPAEEAQIPALMRGYLRLGARVCGEPAVDEDFDTADFLTVLDRQGANARYLDRLSASLVRLGSLS
uniref:GNAT family N-acetyltransferase n=1 Tax=Gordonia sp. B7-2 TaxID=3420932 RepID=UPI003D8E22AF